MGYRFLFLDSDVAIRVRKKRASDARSIALSN
jgi:hypothetical protein